MKQYKDSETGEILTSKDLADKFNTTIENVEHMSASTKIICGLIEIESIKSNVIGVKFTIALSTDTFPMIDIDITLPDYDPETAIAIAKSRFPELNPKVINAVELYKPETYAN
jgi:hypothetical protein